MAWRGDRRTLCWLSLLIEVRLMRAAAFSAASLVAMGTYIALAAPFAFSPLWIGIGLLTIAVATAIVYLATTPARPSARNSDAAAVLRAAD